MSSPTPRSSISRSVQPYKKPPMLKPCTTSGREAKCGCVKTSTMAAAVDLACGGRGGRGGAGEAGRGGSGHAVRARKKKTADKAMAVPAAAGRTWSTLRTWLGRGSRLTASMPRCRYQSANLSRCFCSRQRREKRSASLRHAFALAARVTASVPEPRQSRPPARTCLLMSQPSRMTSGLSETSSSLVLEW